jgi:hypothetical protein
MGLFGFIKDVVLLPVDVVLDVTCITPATRIMNDSNHDTPLGTIDRLRSLGKNLDDTYNK